MQFIMGKPDMIAWYENPEIKTITSGQYSLDLIVRIPVIICENMNH